MTRARAVTVAAGLVALVLCAVLAAGGSLQRLEDSAVDARFALRGEQPARGIAVVAIDERTLSAPDGRWPLPRARHAQVLDTLRAAGARKVVYDVQFTEPSGRPRDDLALYDAVRRTGGVVLATAESDARGRTRVLGGDENLRRADARAASSAFPDDAGGVIRSYEPAVGRLATIAALTAAQLGRPVPASRFADGEALIDFRGPPGTVPTYSFADVVAGRVGADELGGRIVVVGASAASLQDVHPTPVSDGTLMPGPELQANAILTALDGNPLQPTGGWSGTPLVLAVGALALLAVLALGPLWGAAAGLVLAILYAAGAVLAFGQDVVLPVAAPLAGIVAATLAAAATSTAAVVAERRRVAGHNAELEREVQARTAEITRTQLEVVERLARAGELRDDDTGEHVDRMSRMCGELAIELGEPPARAELIRRAAVLHDVGKIGVPDAILHKPGRLTDEEFDQMRGHALAGARLLAGATAPVLAVAEEIARTHHERWDGTGYPARLAGEAIPLVGRIAAVSDVFDALTNERPYKAAWTVEDARAEIERCSGGHFDPDVVAAFVRILERRPEPPPPVAVSA